MEKCQDLHSLDFISNKRRVSKLNYTLTTDKETMQLIANALELYARLKIGQFNHLTNIFFEKDYDYEKVDVLLRELKSNIFPELHSSSFYGIYGESTPDESKELFDVYKRILYEFNKHNKDYNVHSTLPMSASDIEVSVEISNNLYEKIIRELIENPNINTQIIGEYEILFHKDCNINDNEKQFNAITITKIDYNGEYIDRNNTYTFEIYKGNKEQVIKKAAKILYT